jgi:hypothetical protein
VEGEYSAAIRVETASVQPSGRKAQIIGFEDNGGITDDASLAARYYLELDDADQ